MAGKLRIEDLAEKSVFEIGKLIEKGLVPATPALKKFADDAVKHLDRVKQQAIEFANLEKQYKVAPNRKEFNKLLIEEEKLKQQSIRTSQQIQKLEIEKQRVVAQSIRNQKLEIDLQNKKNIQTRKSKELTEKERYEVVKLRHETQKRNKLLKEEIILNSKSSSLIEKITVKRARAVKTIQDLNAKIALGIKLSNKEQKELKESVREYNKYNKAIKIAKNSTGQFQENVGNYPNKFGIASTALRSFIPLVGAGFGLKGAWDFTKELYNTAKEAKGVEFAFKRLGIEGESAFENIKKATRGLLSDLDIKKSIIEFDNFNLSAEELDTVLEFVAVRATQTGKSFEYLRDSAIEAISKESVRRADNLGLSQKELNDKIKEGATFLEAFGDIARREIAEAGDILDEATSSQQLFNAEWENFKVSAGNGFIKDVASSFYDLGTNVLRLINPTKELTSETEKERDGLNKLVTTIITTNKNEEDRKVLIEELTEKYPFFLKFLKDEKTDNDSLRSSLSKVNDMYIKRIALQNVEEKLKKKQQLEGRATEELAQQQRIFAQRLAEVNLKLFKGNSENIKDNIEETSNVLKTEIEKNIRRISKLGSSASDVQRSNLRKYQRGLNYILEIEKSIIGSGFLLDKSKDATNEIKKEISELEKILGITSQEMKDFFSLDEVVINSTKNTKKVKNNLSDIANSAYNLQKFRIEQEIKGLDEIAKSEENSYLDRIKAIQAKEEKQIELAELTEQHLLDNSKLSADQRVLIEEQTSAKLVDIYKDTNEAIDKLKEDALKNAPELIDVDEIQPDIELIKQGIKDYAESLGLDGAEALKEFEKLHGDKFENIKQYFDSLDARAKESAEFRKQLEKDLYNAVSDFTNVLFERKIQGIENEIEANNERYDNAINTAQDRYDEEGVLIESAERRRDILEQERRKKEKELEKKKRKEQRKQDLFNRARSIFEIGINTASAIVKALPNIPLSILAGSIGAIQLATVLSSPLPKYKFGRKGGKAEWALTGDGGVNEVIERKKGGFELTPAKDTLTYLEEGDTVHSSIDAFAESKGLTKKYYDDLERNVVLGNLYAQAQKANDYQQAIIINNRIDEQFVIKAIQQNNVGLKKEIQNGFKNIVIHNHQNINVESGGWER